MSNISFLARVILQSCLPVIKGTALFRSFNGQYNDNPKYISEELHKREPEMKIVWAIKDGSPESFPKYVKTVEINSKEYIKYVARAEVVVDNYAGLRTNFLGENNFLKRLAFSLASRRKRGQLNISTWHGTPLKHIALDEPNYKNKSFSRAYVNADLMLAGCDVTANAYKTALGWGKETLMCGTPRNDILFKTPKSDLKSKLGIPSDKKVILFAPTFRNNVEMSGISQLKSLNMEKLLDTLKERFGEEWCFVFRSHNLVMSKIQDEGLKINEDMINGNQFPDMAEYLSVADVLLTDYSSSMFDYMLTGKPVFLYTPDLDDYKNSERGFYFEIDSTPFSISETVDDLMDKIAKFDSKLYKEKVDDFLKKIGNVENGVASKITVDEILKRIK